MRSLNRFNLVLSFVVAAGLLAAAGGVVFAQPPSPDESNEFFKAAESVFDGVLLKLAPQPLLRRGPYRVLWAQWIGLPIIIAVSWLLGLALTRVSRAMLRPFVHRTVSRWDDLLVERMSAPVALGWTLIFLFFLLQLLGLRPVPLAFAFQVLRAGWVLCFFWAVARGIDVWSATLAATSFGRGMTARRAILPLVSRVLRLLIMGLAIVALLSQLGYSVASILAGLGIGGLAVALAAQKTFEHWFGAFAIAVDQPFREGDFVRIDNLSGTVEQIGIRSTRVRTLERTIVSIPNGKLAEMQAETFAPKDRTRLATDLRLVYGTTSAQVREILAGIAHTLRSHEKVRDDSVSVVLREIATNALVLEVIAFFNTTDASEFARIRQEMLLAFMEVVESAGSELALPAQRVEVASDYARFGPPEARPRTQSDTRELLSAPGTSRRQ